MRGLIIALGISGVGACGDDGGQTDSTDGSTMTSADESGSGSMTASSTGMTTSMDTSSSSSSGGSSSDSSSGGAGQLDIRMTSVMIFQDCMPIVPPDSTGVTIGLSVENIGDAPGTATVETAEFLDAGGVQVGTFTVSPTMIGPVDPGATVTPTLTKDANSINPAMGCQLLPCNQSFDVRLTFGVGGGPMPQVMGNAQVDCAF